MHRFSPKSIGIMAAIACAALGCGLFSSVPSLSGTGSNPLLLEDDFSSNDGGWGTGTDSDSSVEYVNGGLRMQVFRDNFFTWSNPDTETYHDVHMEVTALNDSANTRVGFGLMCNQQVTNSSYHYFAVTSDGEYVIGRSAVGKEDVFLTNNDDWGASDLIPSHAQSYRVGADCGNGMLTLYVNGKQIDSVADTTYSDGGVGLFLWSGDDPTGEVSYDDFVMTSLK